MVKLKVVEDGGAGAVVYEFAAFVEKCGVVLVSLNGKQGSRLACHLLPQPRRDAKVQRHAAHQKAWLQARTFQTPCQHRCGGGFAMRACHSQHMAALQDVFCQPLRAAGVGQALLQNGFHQREFGRAIGQAGAANYVAHHIHIGLQGGLLGSEAFNQLNAKRLQLLAHGRVHARITARYAVPRFTRQGSQAAHKSATDAKNMYVHG